MYLIGLTGNIASGKSTVRRMLQELGARTIDADALSHAVLVPGMLPWRAVVDTFGVEILNSDGTVDRKKLGRLVFGDPERLRKLEAIVHPAVRTQLGLLLRDAREDVIVIEAVKLIEGGLSRFCDSVWVVTTPPEEAERRLMEDRAMSQEDARTRLAAQPPLQDKLKKADVVIDNSEGIEGTRLQVMRAFVGLDMTKPTDKRAVLAALLGVQPAPAAPRPAPQAAPPAASAPAQAPTRRPEPQPARMEPQKAAPAQAPGAGPAPARTQQPASQKPQVMPSTQPPGTRPEARPPHAVPRQAPPGAAPGQASAGNPQTPPVQGQPSRQAPPAAAGQPPVARPAGQSVPPATGPRSVQPVARPQAAPGVPPAKSVGAPGSTPAARPVQQQGAQGQTRVPGGTVAPGPRPALAGAARPRTPEEEQQIRALVARISIRRARPADAPLLGRFIAAAEGSKAPLARSEVLQRFGKWGYWLAEADGQVWAMATWRAENLVAILRDLWVRAPELGPYIYPKLFGAIEQEATSLVCEVLAIIANPNNEAGARQAVLASGFTVRSLESLHPVWRSVAKSELRERDILYIKQIRERMVTSPI